MTPITYELSNRQRKSLLVRGTPLRIALPVPPHEIEDPMSWAQSVLPRDVRQYVRSAEEQEITVDPLTIGENLTGVLGAIREYDRDQPRWLLTVVVVVVTLEPDDIRHKPERLAWPLQCRFFDEVIG
jgi:hypothetical protein